jgi:NodT family efflux transporter outer membrane factor (OMF) lipoprotein
MKRSQQLCGLALLVALVGCSLGPAYQRPEVAVPTAWKQPSEPGVWPAADWWQGFGSPELDALVATAERNNNDIAAAAARILQADAQLRIAGAPLLPTLDAAASANRQKSASLRRVSTSGSSAFDSYSASLAASYEVDFWGKNGAALAAAQASALASRYDRETVALTVLSNVATTYFQVLEFRDRLTVARQNLANAESVLAVVEARVRNGAASALDLAQQRAAVAGQRAAIPPLEVQAQQAENALAILLGLPPEAAQVGPGTLGGLAVPAVAPGLPSELLVRRPDIQNAEAQLLAANADIKAARAAFFPAVQLTGQFGFESLALGSLFNAAGTFYSLAAGLTQPIFEGGRLSGQVDLAKGRYQELVAGYRTAVISAFSDVENALVATRLTADQLALQENAVTEARLAYELAQTRYREGAVDLLTVLDAQRTLFQAEDQLVQVRFARLQASVALYKALGGGWKIP